MKFVRLLLLTIIIHQLSIINCTAQAGEWTWVRGDSTVNSTGSYGPQGIPSPTNEPAARYACGYWTDTAGNFWIYSGTTFLGVNDLWKFDPQTTEWTWMNGNNTVTNKNIAGGIGAYNDANTPGYVQYGMFTWVTPDNHLWLFGGVGESINDLWQYDPGVNEWAWMGNFGQQNYGTLGTGSSSTMPGGRTEGNCAWVDGAGNLWLFGGAVNYISDGVYNDMWKYDVSSGIWTWMSGSQNLDDPGSYGVIGQPSVSNYPAGRATNVFWKDDAGNFWLAGGTMVMAGDGYVDYTYYQDVWKFNPQTMEWTWVKGMEGDDESTLGANCMADSTNKEGPRYENRAIMKMCNNLLLNYGNFNGTNDLWAYGLAQNEWMKVDSWGRTGSYGTLGVTSPSNYPPYRYGPVGFKDRENNIWIFEGQLDARDSMFYYNDLWRYVPDTACLGALSCSRNCSLAPPVITTNLSKFCANDSTRICAAAGFSSYSWNTSFTGADSCINVNQAGNYYVTVTDANGCTAESNHLSISVFPVPSVSIIQQGDTLTSFGQTNYQWIFNNTSIPGATGQLYVAHQHGSYSVEVTDTNGCTTISNPVIISGIQDLAEESISIFPNPSAGNWQLTVGNELVGAKLEVYDEQARLVMKDEVRTTKYDVTAGDLPAGVYYLRISNEKVSVVRKLVKM